jgi:hypothetical protein
MPDHERMGAAKEPAANDLMLREDEPEVKVGLQPVKVRLQFPARAVQFELSVIPT